MSDIVFIHGMFQNPKSWAKWVAYFEARGYRCHAPAWPLHEGEPGELRANVPAGTGDLVLKDLNGALAEFVATLPEPPILIGHSLGGLIAQVLANEGRAAAVVAICPVAPNGMLSFDWDFLKNSTTIMNPLKGDDPQEMTPEQFHEVFANVMGESESRAAWEETAVHESRNVLRTALGEAGHVDLKRTHEPLLFLAASEDRIIPPGLVVKNFESYGEGTGVAAMREFAGHGHFICGEPGWETVADYVAGWLENEVTRTTAKPTGAG